MMNVLNGGKHANNSSDFQEFMIIPIAASSYETAVQMCVVVFQKLRKGIAALGGSSAVGDEGGLTLEVKSNEQMLVLLNKACEAAGYTPGKDICYALDVAATELYHDGKYVLACDDRTLTGEDMIHFLDDWVQRYPIVSIEDGLAEDDWSHWTQLTQRLSDVQLVGDDLLVTNITRLQHALDSNAANAILIKPNQIGTLTETVSAIKLAQNNGWRTIVSHRSGETEDTTIAHLAVGTGAGQIKTGSVTRSERTAKHNELMRIESIDAGLVFSSPFA